MTPTLPNIPIPVLAFIITTLPLLIGFWFGTRIGFRAGRKIGHREGHHCEREMRLAAFRGERVGHREEVGTDE